MSTRRRSDPRDVVLGSAIRIDVNLTSGSKTLKGFATWDVASAWLSSFLAARGPDVGSIRVINQGAQAGGTRRALGEEPPLYRPGPPPRNNTNGDTA
jgi:hypothetical protein